MQPKQTFVPAKSSHCKLELLFSSSVPPAATPSVQPQFTSDSDSDYNPDPIVLQSREAEDEYTLSAYGDISLSEVMVPPLPAPAPSSPGVLEPRFSQPRLRLKVRRPPMPKCRPSYTYISGPLPCDEDVEPDERWPGSPRPIVNVSVCHVASCVPRLILNPLSESVVVAAPTTGISSSC